MEKDLVKAYLLQMYDLLLHAPAAPASGSQTAHAPEAFAVQTEIPLLNDIPETHVPLVPELPMNEPEPEPEPEEEPEAEPMPEVIPEEDTTVAEMPVPETEPEPLPESEEEDEGAPVPPEETNLLHSVPHEREELTLNERLSQAQDKKALLDKLMHTPIDNIKSHITLNKKVAFIIGLFNQESDDYTKAIEDLNTANNLQEALDIFHVLKSRYGWGPGVELARELEILVRRRYSAGN